MNNATQTKEIMMGTWNAILLIGYTKETNGQLDLFDPEYTNGYMDRGVVKATLWGDHEQNYTAGNVFVDDDDANPIATFQSDHSWNADLEDHNEYLIYSPEIKSIDFVKVLRHELV
jgi:hypothetical protein